MLEKLKLGQENSTFNIPSENDCFPCFPSIEYIDLTLGASGSTYIAPANGWFSCSSDGIVNIMLSNQEFTLTITGASGFAPFGYVPVKKGEKFIFAYSSNQNNKIRFYYAKGQSSIVKY